MKTYVDTLHRHWNPRSLSPRLLGQNLNPPPGESAVLSLCVYAYVCPHILASMQASIHTLMRTRLPIFIHPSFHPCAHACMTTSRQTNAHSSLADYEYMLTNEYMLPKNALAASARLREKDREISNIGPWRAALEDDGTLSVDTFPPPPSPSLGGGEGRTDTHKHMLICMQALLHIRKFSNRSPSH